MEEERAVFQKGGALGRKVGFVDAADHGPPAEGFADHGGEAGHERSKGVGVAGREAGGDIDPGVLEEVELVEFEEVEIEGFHRVDHRVALALEAAKGGGDQRMAFTFCDVLFLPDGEVSFGEKARIDGRKGEVDRAQVEGADLMEGVSVVKSKAAYVRKRPCFRDFRSIDEKRLPSTNFKEVGDRLGLCV